MSSSKWDVEKKDLEIKNYIEIKNPIEVLEDEVKEISLEGKIKRKKSRSDIKVYHSTYSS